MLSYPEACAITGFLGDFGLQILDRGKWGLTEYFNKHGRLESMFTAAGMLAVFGTMWVYFAGGPPTIMQAMIYGAFLDMGFRYEMPMKSLSTYYRECDLWFTIPWGGIPFVMALFIMNVF